MFWLLLACTPEVVLDKSPDSDESGWFSDDTSVRESADSDTGAIDTGTIDTGDTSVDETGESGDSGPSPTCAVLTPSPGPVIFRGATAETDMTIWCSRYNVASDDLMVYQTPLADLTPLSCLCEVRGDLTVSTNLALTSLAGLDLLTTVEGATTISYNERLSSLGGLDQLAAVGGWLQITYNALDSLAGLGALASAGDVMVQANGVDSLAGLENLGEIESLAIVDEPDILGLEGLDRLHTVDVSLLFRGLHRFKRPSGTSLISVGHIEVYEMPAMVDFGGLEGLSELASINVIDAPALLNFSGFDGLVLLNDHIEVADADRLVSFEGLEALQQAQWFALDDVPALRDLTGLNSLYSLERLTIGSASTFQSVSGAPSLAELGALELRAVPQVTTLSELAGARIGSLVLSELATLSTLDGLQASGPVLDALVLSELPLLTGVGELSRITESSGSLTIWDCDSLVDLSGLEALVSIGYMLEIEGNAALDSVSALHGVSYVGADLRVSANPGLSDEERAALVAAIEAGVVGAVVVAP